MGKVFRAFLMVLVVILAQLAQMSLAKADFRQGVFAYNRGDYAIALKQIRPLAKQGSAAAQSLLGKMYLNGNGVIQDYGQAVKWFRKAAEQGLVNAQEKLGYMYEYGNGVAQNNSQAVKWYRKAAEHGFEPARTNLARLEAKIKAERNPDKTTPSKPNKRALAWAEKNDWFGGDTSKDQAMTNFALKVHKELITEGLLPSENVELYYAELDKRIRHKFPEEFNNANTSLPPCLKDEGVVSNVCFGTFTYSDGGNYVGEWVNGKEHGHGTKTYGKDTEWAGDKYVGEFKDGSINGQGSYTFASGDKYVGEFKDGSINGQGSYTFASGDKYVGEFKDGLQHGQGTFTYADRTVEEGVWDKGKFKYARKLSPAATQDAPMETKRLSRHGDDVALAFPSKPIDVQFPSSGSQPDDIAVIIGNADYQKGKDIPNVITAYADAASIKNYVTQALGIGDENIIHLKDASQGELTATFGSATNPKGQLYNYVKPGKSRVFVYYSGHGAPGGEDGSSYIVPTDAQASLIDLNGYPLSTLYKNLGQIPAKSVTVVLEACFSGASQSGSVITQASPIYLKAKETSIPSNITVIAAGAANQIASWEKDSSSGLFTKYFLKGMSGEADAAPYGNGDGKVEYAELEGYFKDTMTYYARRYYGRDQTVQIVEGGM
jgi:hypothetical protein